MKPQFYSPGTDLVVGANVHNFQGADVPGSALRASAVWYLSLMAAAAATLTWPIGSTYADAARVSMVLIDWLI